MIVEEIKNSIKAKLYDFAYTPFMSSVLIAWLILNHKYILIYFADFDLDKKLLLLNKYDFAFHFYVYDLPCANNVIFPILFGLFYVFIYPLISKIFYEYTLERTKELKTIKQSIEDETPLTQVEAREIRKLATTLEEEKDKALESLRKKDDEYKEKLESTTQPLQNDINAHLAALNISNKLIDTLKAEQESLQHKFDQSNSFLAAKNDECAELQEQIDQLQAHLKTGGNVKTQIVNKKSVLDTNNPDYISIIEFLHDSFDPTTESTLLNQISSQKKVGKTLARKVINDLIDEKILEKNSKDIIYMTKEGVQKILDRAEEGFIPF